MVDMSKDPITPENEPLQPEGGEQAPVGAEGEGLEHKRMGRRGALKQLFKMGAVTVPAGIAATQEAFAGEVPEGYEDIHNELQKSNPDLKKHVPNAAEIGVKIRSRDWQDDKIYSPQMRVEIWTNIIGAIEHREANAPEEEDDTTPTGRRTPEAPGKGGTPEKETGAVEQFAWNLGFPAVAQLAVSMIDRMNWGIARIAEGWAEGQKPNGKDIAELKKMKKWTHVVRGSLSTLDFGRSFTERSTDVGLAVREIALLFRYYESTFGKRGSVVGGGIKSGVGLGSSVGGWFIYSLMKKGRTALGWEAPWLVSGTAKSRMPKKVKERRAMARAHEKLTQAIKRLETGIAKAEYSTLEPAKHNQWINDAIQTINEGEGKKIIDLEIPADEEVVLNESPTFVALHEADKLSKPRVESIVRELVDLKRVEGDSDEEPEVTEPVAEEAADTGDESVKAEDLAEEGEDEEEFEEGELEEEDHEWEEVDENEDDEEGEEEEGEEFVDEDGNETHNPENPLGY